MVDLGGLCNEEPIRAHFIQEGLLKTIADNNGKVHSLYSFAPGGFVDKDFYGKRLLRDEIYTRSAARQKFVCATHEKLFLEMERPEPDWGDPRHKTLLTYRTLLADSYVKEWFANACDLVGLRGIADTQRRMLRFAAPLTAIARDALTGNNYDNMHHSIIDMDFSSAIAATGVIPSVPRGSFIYNQLHKSIIPISTSPVAISILPSRDRQVLLLSCARNDFLNIQHLLDKFGYSNGSVSPSLLSKAVLEEMELIHISPCVWDSYGVVKQERIVDYLLESVGTTEREFYIPAHQLNLFTMEER